MDRIARQRAALRACLEALRLVAREMSHVAEDGERSRWVAVGLVTALQGALIAALSGYETAAAEDVMDAAGQGHHAPVSLLLRRARSEDYLAAPEQLRLSLADRRAIDALIDIRNAALHGVPLPESEPVSQLVPPALTALKHLLVNFPAFAPENHRVEMACLKDTLNRLYQGAESNG